MSVAGHSSSAKSSAILEVQACCRDERAKRACRRFIAELMEAQPIALKSRDKMRVAFSQSRANKSMFLSLFEVLKFGIEVLNLSESYLPTISMGFVF